MSRSHRKYNFPPATLRPVNSPLVYFTPPPVVPGSPQQLPRPAQRSVGTHRPRRTLPTLPAEVISDIVGLIWHEPTLLACQRTARAFYPPARRNLFYKIYIAFPSRSRYSGQKSPRSLYVKIKDFSYLAPLIRGLVVSVAMDYRDTAIEANQTWEDEYQRTYLAKAISRLPTLYYLEFPNHRLEKNEARKWTPTRFFPALPDLQAWNIKDLDISALKGQQSVSIHSLAKLLPNLNRLTVDLKGTLAGDAAGQVRGTFPKRPLETLEIVGMSQVKESIAVILGPTFPFDIAQTLRTLAIDQSDQHLIYLENVQGPRDLSDLPNLLRTCRNLTEFRFGPCPCDEYIPENGRLLTPFAQVESPPDISGLYIKRLVFEGKVNEGHDRYIPSVLREISTAATPLRWIVTLLRTVNPRAPSPLREVELTLWVGFHSCQQLLDVLFRQWNELCEVLLSPRFPRLRKVHIKLLINHLGVIRVRYYRDIPNHPGLEKLRRAGVLQYEFSYYES